MATVTTIHERRKKEPPSKRQRLDDRPYAAMETREPAGGTSLDVDIMILDYLAYEATAACFTIRSSKQDQPAKLLKSLHRHFAMTNDFVATFRDRHPDYTSDADLRFRLMLLQLVTLFTQRLTHNASTQTPAALARLRETNIARAREWIGTAERLPSAAFYPELYDGPAGFLSKADLERNRAQVLHSLSVPPELAETEEDAHYGTEACVSLLDILPHFMRVSAARVEMTSGSLNEAWMIMAAEFCLQAALEQYLVCGAAGTDVIDEAFAWGKRAVDEMTMHESPGADDEVNDMFTDAVHEEEVKEWAGVRDAYLSPLFYPETTHASKDLLGILQDAAAEHPVAAFDATILSYLQAMAQSISKPVLVQLECGQLDGMSKAETQDFLKGCDLNLSSFFTQPYGFK
ncbi:hypothetical protein LTR62_002576 [Meristemomyces frigidus]|uniref:Uncharacterized protein n=1 Tax=Meristemomyces frigidus TaxID=1508187 RepID=A0AAN7TJF5_9PEZI|nr:hypothetical protein LTR62_002576 [Meristemomyces frigidus]